MRIILILLIFLLPLTPLFSKVWFSEREILQTRLAPEFDNEEAFENAQIIIPDNRRLPERDPIIGEIFVAGDTWWDSQCSGAIGKMIAVDQSGNVHITWMDADDENINVCERNQKYNFYSPQDEEWLAEDGNRINNGNRGGYGCLWLTNEEEQRALSFYHTKINQGGEEEEWISMCGVDWFAGVGVFQSGTLPRYPERPVEWPQGVMSPEGAIHVVYNRQDGRLLSYTRGSINQNDIPEFGDHPQQIERAPMNTYRIARSPVSERAAIVYLRNRIGFEDLGPWEGYLAWQMNNNLMLATTEDGENWNFDDPFNITRIVPPNAELRGSAAYGDTLRPFRTFDVIFDHNDNLHVVFDARLLLEQPVWENEPPVDGMSTDAAMLYHWSEETDRITPVAGGWFSHTQYDENGNIVRRIDPGYWKESNVCFPSLGYDEAGDLYCIFNYYPPDDYSRANFCNGDISATVSEDNGESWHQPTRITETRTLEAEIGESASETFPTLWEVVDEYLHIAYVFDTEPGSPAINYPNRIETATLCEFYYHRVPVDEIEREEIFEAPPFHTEIRQMINWVERSPDIPLPDENVTVRAEIEAAEGHELQEVFIEYRFGGNRNNLGEVHTIDMEPGEDNVYSAELPALDADTYVWYRVVAHDEEEFESIWPERYWYSYVLREGGNLLIEDIQYRSPDWSVDYSPYMGYEVTLRGIVTTPPEFNETYDAVAIQSHSDYWAGIFIRGIDPALDIGMEIEATGIVRERDEEQPDKWRFMTYLEVSDQENVEILGEADPIAPLEVDVEDLKYSTHAEHLEGVLIELQNIEIDTIRNIDPPLDVYLPITDAMGEEENEGWLTTLGMNDREKAAAGVDDFAQGTVIPWLVGVFAENYKYAIAPRNAEDFSPNVSVDHKTGEIPEDFSLLSIYPNPFNDELRIKFKMAKAADIEIGVFDLSGRMARSVHRGHFQPGTHDLQFNAAGLANGVYILKLASSESVLNSKVVLLR